MRTWFRRLAAGRVPERERVYFGAPTACATTGCRDVLTR